MTLRLPTRAKGTARQASYADRPSPATSRPSRSGAGWAGAACPLTNRTAALATAFIRRAKAALALTQAAGRFVKAAAARAKGKPPDATAAATFV